MFHRIAGVVAIVAAVVLSGCGGSGKNDGAAAPGAPKPGAMAPPLSLATLDGAKVELAALLNDGPAVIVQLRGWVGYQCPLCTRQVGDLIANADAFAAKKARVLLVYPGPADALDTHAREFITGNALPPHFLFLTDPGLAFVNAWGLRWDAPGETAYPAAFVVDTVGTVQYANVSNSHGGRAGASEILVALGN